MSGGAGTVPHIDSDKVRDALDGMTARDLERMRDLINKRLALCILCNEDGAEAFHVTRHGITASVMLCPACFEKHRLPGSRSDG